MVLLMGLLFAFSGCKSAYNSLQTVEGSGGTITDPACILKFRPEFGSTLYNTQVNVVGRHLSGLLLFKLMPDSSMRIVFTSEMGAKFFDFEFSNNGDFKVHQVMSQLNKKAVIKTLRSDFELLLMRNIDLGKTVLKKDSTGLWYGFPAPKETHYYITDAACSKLIRIENAMKRKPKVQMKLFNYHNGVPDSIGISHRNFNFEIGLKYIQR
ncbi:MAG: hypothetical protein EOO02_02700 [Chitinophagaceae bacterium]|nr:MAG: hypothetical protein EOO02_02700 [Chitinophagaceae bacterium]